MTAEAAGLAVHLESPLPGPRPTGKAMALFVSGTCWHGHEEVAGLDVAVDGVRHAVTAFGRQRLDILQLPADGDPAGRRLRSGFWATVPIPARDRPGTVVLEAVVRLRGGAELTAPLGRLEIVAPAPRPDLGARPAREGGELIAICMATFEPDPELFRVQVESIKAQTDDRWVCLVSDDCSRPEHVAAMREAIGDDPRFGFSRSETRLGFYRNFERVITLAPPDALGVALADQDDRWHPDKVATLRAALGDATLVYSDQRLVDAAGNVLRSTMWEGRSNNHTSLASMVVANTVTGAAMLLRRDVAELAVPFPDTPGAQFHDHWLGLLGIATGRVAYVDRPLYDYVQHAGAIFGEVTTGRGRGGADAERPALGARAKAAAHAANRFVRDPLASWRSAYFEGFLNRDVQVRTLLLRCGDRLTPAKRRTLERYAAAPTSLAALAWLAARPARELAGRNETLGSELLLAQGAAWLRLNGALNRARPLQGRAVTDARFPSPNSFQQKRLRRWRARI